MRVLGIDPGSRVTGFGVIEGGPGLEVISWGVIRLGGGPLPERLWKIFSRVTDLLMEFRPQAVVLEEVIPETFPRAALRLGQAQGAAILAAAQNGLPVYLYHPLEVKQALTGYGNASKEQTAYMVKYLLGIKERLPLDASDALSVAIYHLQNIKREEAWCSPK